MKKSYLVSAALAAVLFSGCGGGSGSASSTGTSTGIFADAPVQGLGYKTATQSGFTDAQGQFKYKTGETVEFKLGTLLLGRATGKALLTPYNISDNNNTAVNIALLLQNFDSNRSNPKVINVSKLKDYNFSSMDFNLSISNTDMENKLQVLYADNNFAQYRDINNTVIAASDTKNNMDANIQCAEYELSGGFNNKIYDASGVTVLNYVTCDQEPLFIGYTGSLSTVSISSFSLQSSEAYGDNLIKSFPNGKYQITILNSYSTSSVELIALTDKYLNALASVSNMNYTKHGATFLKYSPNGSEVLNIYFTGSYAYCKIYDTQFNLLHSKESSSAFSNNSYQIQLAAGDYYVEIFNPHTTSSVQLLKQ